MTYTPGSDPDTAADDPPADNPAVDNSGADDEVANASGASQPDVVRPNAVAFETAAVRIAREIVTADLLAADLVAAGVVASHFMAVQRVDSDIPVADSGAAEPAAVEPSAACEVAAVDRRLTARLTDARLDARRAGAGAGAPVAVPRPRDTSDGRHRRGVSVAAVLAQDGDVEMREAAVRPPGSHRRRPSNRHRAAGARATGRGRGAFDADEMAHRRSIGWRPTRGIGRTALGLVALLVMGEVAAGPMVGPERPVPHVIASTGMPPI